MSVTIDTIEDDLKALYARVLLLGLWAMAQRRESPWTFEVSSSETK